MGNRSLCQKPDCPGHRKCRECHAAYMRRWRKGATVSIESRLRANARAYAKVYLKRGKIDRKPCETCGAQESQMHHEDYSKPLEVTWLCRPCHLSLHGKKPGRYVSP